MKRTSSRHPKGPHRSRWGLGVAARFTFSTNPGGDIPYDDVATYLVTLN